MIRPRSARVRSPTRSSTSSERALRRKVTVVGAGMVGRTVAQEVARRDYADVVIVDIVSNLAKGIALDLDEAAPVLGYEANVTGSEGYEETAGSDVVVIT